MRHVLIRLLATALCCTLVTLAQAEVVVAVSEQSSIKTLSRLQLTDIYLGRLTQLPSGYAVTPLDQAEPSGSHHQFYQHYLGRTAAEIRAHWSRLIFTGRGQPPKAVAGDAAMADALIDNPSAVGYLNTEALREGLRVIDIDS